MSISSARAEMEKLQFLDQDNEALPESPSKNHDFPSVPQNSSAATEANYGRNNESQHDREEAREFSLRSELESIRNINRVVEGIIHSLDRAKDNMEVSFYPIGPVLFIVKTFIFCFTERFPYRRIRVYTFKHLDTNPSPDGTKSTTHPKSFLARRIQRYCRY